MYVCTDTLPKQATSRDAHAIRGRLRTLPRPTIAVGEKRRNNHPHTRVNGIIVSRGTSCETDDYGFRAVWVHGDSKTSRSTQKNVAPWAAVTNAWTCGGNNRNHVVWTTQHSRRRTPKTTSALRTPLSRTIL